jgi:uncharacterized membrane protein YkvA (DUF1232 family)
MEIIKQTLNKLKELSAEVHALAIAYTNPRTPILAKLIIGLTVGYFFSPIDLIPDFIPILGSLDDIIIVPALILLAIKLLPKEILIKSRQKAKENPIRITKNNWIFAAMIVIVWLAFGYILISFLNKK